MKLNIVTIGDEILIGQVVDTNSAWIAQKMNQIGISIHRIISISDKKEEIINSIKESFESSDVVLLTGGLGPTNDDITKHTLNEYFNGNMVCHKPTLEHITQLFARRGLGLTEPNRLQAYFPDVATVLPNIHGTAPGLMFNKDGKMLFAMPGVPYEMKYIVETSVIPLLKDQFKLPVILHKTVLTQGVAESILAEYIEPWEKALPSYIKIAYLPSPGTVRIRLSAIGKDEASLEQEIQHQVKELTALIGTYVFGYDEDTLESIIGRQLKEKGVTLSTAESCTGGAIASIITSVSGSSLYFKGSVVAYDNSIKVNTLKVKGEDVVNFGAVSELVVKQMALGVREMFHTDYAIATSGIAGPLGGTPDKPVGTVWIAVASNEKVIAKKFMFGQHRGRNITRSVKSALNMLRKLLIDEI